MYCHTKPWPVKKKAVTGRHSSGREELNTNEWWYISDDGYISPNTWAENDRRKVAPANILGNVSIKKTTMRTQSRRGGGLGVIGDHVLFAYLLTGGVCWMKAASSDMVTLLVFLGSLGGRDLSKRMVGLPRMLLRIISCGGEDIHDYSATGDCRMSRDLAIVKDLSDYDTGTRKP